MSAIRMLRRSLETRPAARAAADVAVTNVVMLLVGLTTGVLTARLLGAEGRGELGALLVWPQFLGYAFAFALPGAVLYHAKSDPEHRAELAGVALLLSAGAGCLAWAIGAAAMPWLLPSASRETVATARWLAAFAPFGTVSTVLVALLQVAENFKLYNRVRYLPQVLTLAALVALTAWPGVSPRALALVYLLPGVPAFGWMLWWVVRTLRPSLRGAPLFARRLLSYSARAYGGEAASTLLAQVDKIMLVSLLAPAAYGVYVVVFNFSRLLTMLPTAIAPVLLPRNAGRTATEVTASTGRALSVATPVAVLGTVALALGGDLALRILYGAEFASGYLSLCVLAAEAAIAGIAYLLLQPYLALNRPGVITIVQIVSVVVLGAAIWALAPRFGLEGAALAVLLATLVRTFATYFAYRKTLAVMPPRLWPDAGFAYLRKLREAP
jgi:O-antigen/teichoic acid export membrane protein